MNRLLVFLFTLLVLGCGTSYAKDEPLKEDVADDASYFGGKKVLVAYFSWGGTTQRMAAQIQEITGGDIFRIEPVVPYPTEYTPCTEVTREEKDNNARPEIKDKVQNWEDYDIIFIGCPVWWWTTPMIIHTFCESYDFTGKTVVPFCTYAATYRDETLAEIINITPEASHLTGEGLTGASMNAQRIQTWIDLINEEWNNNNPADTGNAVMTGKVNLWEKGNIPTVTHNVNNSDGPDFIPNLEVFTVTDNVRPKGAVMICPGGAFMFRSMQNEGYDIADMLTSMGYQCFVVNYRINPYTMQESATDLQRGIRYVKAHADEYRIKPENIALVGFSAGGILNGEVLLNWRDLKNGTALDNTYVPDELDNVPVYACAVGMIYSFYGRLSVSMNNVETLHNANLPPAFYCWGTRDGFAGQFTQNANAVEQAGCRVERKILQNYPHGYGTGGNYNVWGRDFDTFLSDIMSGSSAINNVNADVSETTGKEVMYDLYGRQVPTDTAKSGIYIVKNGHRQNIKEIEMKPEVICHIMSSVDGRLLPSRWTLPFDGTDPSELFKKYAALGKSLETDTWMFGKATAREAFPYKFMPKTTVHPKAGKIHIGNRDSARLFITVDPDADIFYTSDRLRGDNIVTILGTNATDDYLTMLEEKGISYMVLEDPTALDEALDVLYDKFGVRRISLQGGGIINGAMLAAGLISELSLVIYPGIDGLTTSPSIFEYLGASDECPASGQSLELISSQTFDNGIVWLRYRFHRDGL